MNLKRIGALIVVACMLLAGVAVMMPTVSAGKPLPPSLLQLNNPLNVTDGYFGSSIAAGDGVIVVGGPGGYNDGRVEVFNATSKAWIASLESPNEYSLNGNQFGFSVAIGGGLIFVGAPSEDTTYYYGAGCVFVYDVETRGYIATLSSINAESGGSFGSSLATDGTYLVIGARWEGNASYVNMGRAYVYTLNDLSSTSDPIATLETQNPDAYGYFGYSVAVDGGRIVVGAPEEKVGINDDAGRVYVYSVAGLPATGAEPVLTLTSSTGLTDQLFGERVLISGKTIVVGAPGYNSYAGAVYLFSTSGRLTKTLTSPNAVDYGYFGDSIAFEGRTLVIGAGGEWVNETESAGHVYVFSSSGRLTKTLTSPTPAHYGWFGSVAIDNGMIVIGASGETASGLTYAGNAYVYA